MPTHYKGAPAETRALDAYVKLMRCANSVQGRLDRHLAGCEVTESQFGILEALLHLGPLSQGIIGRKLLTSGGNVTVVVDNLEKRGLVRRERGTADRRVVTVHLTAEGRRFIERIFPAHVKNIVDALAPLTAAEQLELAKLCRKLGLGHR